MEWSFNFLINSAFLGIGLAMDAFSVSLANGLHEPKMKRSRICLLAGIYAFFQFFMPMLGWFCVHTATSVFSAFQKWIPYIALLLLSFIGSKMLFDGMKPSDNANNTVALGFGALLLQGVATSIDALSVGFTIANYSTKNAFSCCLIIALITFLICIAGIFLGKRFGTMFAGKASLLGGVILISIGLEIFISHLI